MNGSAGRLSFELRDRTKRFGSSAIRLFISLPKNREEVSVCGKQFLRSATSVAAHAREASRARSEAEFSSKLGGALQECDESQLWLEFLRDDCGISRQTIDPICEEADELIAIFTTMIKRTKARE
jgi:four helix bundle protein